MPNFMKDDLERILSGIRSSIGSDWIKKLAQSNKSFPRIAHFGCSSGAETLALMGALGADEVFGIDRDISGANTIIGDLKSYIQVSRQALPYISEEDKSWWLSIPRFIKEKLFPVFIQELDIAHPVKPYQLPPEYFDLACCSNLLCIILDKQGENDVHSAIEEMVRVTKVDGWIVCDEPGNGERELFVPFFDSAGLEKIEVIYTEFMAGYFSTTYYYRKIND